jgi:hypothetical protein
MTSEVSPCDAKGQSCRVASGEWLLPRWLTAQGAVSIGQQGGRGGGGGLVH